MAATIICAIQEGTAESVARTGGELARGLAARLVLAHVQKDPPLFNSTTDRERARHRSRRRGRGILRRAQDSLPDGVEADTRVELGLPATRLAELAAEIGADLIVVGPPGRGRLASALLGSVSETLARVAPCPVVVLTEAATAALGMPAQVEARKAA